MQLVLQIQVMGDSLKVLRVDALALLGLGWEEFRVDVWNDTAL